MSRRTMERGTAATLAISASSAKECCIMIVNVMK